MAVNAVGLRTAALRVPLFGVLAIGVLSMHTIGHSSEHEGWVPTPAAGLSHMVADIGGTSGMAGKRPATQRPDDPGHACDGMSCAGSAARVGDRVPYPSDAAGFVVTCLAVLVGVAIAALLAAMLSRHRRWRPPPNSARSTSLRWTRDPFPHFTLRIVDVAVLRT